MEEFDISKIDLNDPFVLNDILGGYYWGDLTNELLEQRKNNWDMKDVNGNPISFGDYFNSKGNRKVLMDPYGNPASPTKILEAWAKYKNPDFKDRNHVDANSNEKIRQYQADLNIKENFDMTSGSSDAWKNLGKVVGPILAGAAGAGAVAAAAPAVGAALAPHAGNILAGTIGGESINLATRLGSNGKYKGWGDFIALNLKNNLGIEIPELITDLTNPGYFFSAKPFIEKPLNAAAERIFSTKPLAAIVSRDNSIAAKAANQVTDNGSKPVSEFSTELLNNVVKNAKDAYFKKTILSPDYKRRVAYANENGAGIDFDAMVQEIKNIEKSAIQLPALPGVLDKIALKTNFGKILIPRAAETTSGESFVIRLPDLGNKILRGIRIDPNRFTGAFNKLRDFAKAAVHEWAHTLSGNILGAQDAETAKISRELYPNLAKLMDWNSRIPLKLSQQGKQLLNKYGDMKDYLLNPLEIRSRVFQGDPYGYNKILFDKNFYLNYLKKMLTPIGVMLGASSILDDNQTDNKRNYN